MSRVTPAQASFNGGELSRRLRSRIDQSIRAIGLAEMTGFAPLVEGPAEAMPGTLHVAQAPGPFRPLRFEYNATQGHVLEASDLLFRVYTNDALLEDGGGPVEIVSPYSWEQVQALKTHQSYDVLYCFHRDLQTREFYRTDATTFGFDLLELENGPFDDRNDDESLTISASAVSGTIDLLASADLFAATDVGRLVKIEVRDFGDTPAWEPGITVDAGQYRTSLERVYRAVTSGRTGSWQPSHTEGVEWDGMAAGQDLNEKDAGGIQWEFIHDKYGIARITAFTDAQNVEATVLRRLPFSAVGGSGGTGNYTYEDGYFDGGWTPYTPGGVTYQYGTWRWSLGAFSDTTGYPQAGCIWNERLLLMKDSTGYASVAGDLHDFAELNELGEQSNDMAFTFTIPDPNEIVEVAADDKLLLFTAAGCWALGPASAAQGVGPKNLRLDRQHHSGSSAVDAVALDGRTLTVSRCGTRIYETDFDAGRQIESAVDLTRYARHIGRPGFTSLAQQRHPHNHVWACRGDGSLACAAYLPEEDVLGMATRPLAEGLTAHWITSITDPEGKFEQVWIAAEFGGDWHMLRMAPWREDGESDESACMVDMAFAYDGAPATAFAEPLLAGQAIHVVADGRFYETTAAAGTGAFTLDTAASRVVWGLPFDAALESLTIEAGGDTGAARHKMARIGRGWIEVIDARGLAFGAPGDMQNLEQLADGDDWDAGWSPESGYRDRERVGDYTRYPRVRVERRAPFQATVAAWGYEIEVKQR